MDVNSPGTDIRSLQVQHIVPEVTIPPEVTPENVTTYIVDSGSGYTLGFSTQRTHDITGSDPDRTHLESEIRKAHVICIVYAIDDPNSFSRIPAHWLPYFRQLGVNASVVQCSWVCRDAEELHRCL